MPRYCLSCRVEHWPLAAAFVIARGAKSEAAVVVAEIDDGVHRGFGECVPYGRYGETVDGVMAELEAAGSLLTAIDDASPSQLRHQVQTGLPAGAARNALDCALWDLEARQTGLPVATLAGVDPPATVLTAYTLSLDTPKAMAAKAGEMHHLPLLKLKLGGHGDGERMRAVRAARPDARLIADANEAWTLEMLGPLLAIARETGMEVIEQPLPADGDGALAGLPQVVPLCADESLHTRADLARLALLYQGINVKLDKAGGLTEALALVTEARRAGLDVMVGSMVATSLSMAPALILARQARWVDLDSPLLLARDRPGGLTVQQGMIDPPAPGFWGSTLDSIR